MRLTLILITIIYLVSCDSAISFYDKEYYERISGIKVPGTATVLESIDNGEFVTITSFKVDSIAIERLTHTYRFQAVEDPFSYDRLLRIYLRKIKPDYSGKTKLVYIVGQKGKNSWLYVLDKQKGLLWVEIQHPDAEGFLPDLVMSFRRPGLYLDLETK
jgi:hypothetical protein